MLVTKHLSRSAKARLYFVVTHYNVVVAAEGLQFLRILHGKEIRAASLIGLRHYTRDIARFDLFFVEALKEQLERCLLILIAVGKWHLHKCAITVNHPLLLLLAPPGELGAHRAPVERIVE